MSEEKLGDKLKHKLEILHFINEARWSRKDNYYLPNYHPRLDKKEFENEKDEAKLLTHWLCYISDRQTSFRRIFDVGAYVYSYIVYLFYKEPKEEIIDILNDCFKSEKRRFEVPLVLDNKNSGENEIKRKKLGDVIFTDKNTEGEEVEKVYFASRFMPADIVCIYKTLKTLRDNYNGSFAEFLRMNSVNVNTLAKALFDLTYNGIGAWSFDRKRAKKGGKSLAYIKQLLSKEESGEKLLIKDEAIQSIDKFEEQRFVQKRLWCVIRDFLRCQHFNDMFVKIVGENFFIKNNRDFLKDLELPGDVWNNNDKFLSCFWKVEEKQLETVLDEYEGNLPQKIREFWNKNKDKTPFISEDYDTTFEFVPRMCAKEECKFCPFNFDNSEVIQLCHNNQGKICPVIKFCSGYNFECVGENDCEICKKHKEK